MGGGDDSDVHVLGEVFADGADFLSWITRRSLDWSATFISPISSRKACHRGLFEKARLRLMLR